jgi:hypothetical protein
MGGREKEGEMERKKNYREYSKYLIFIKNFSKEIGGNFS